MSTARLLSIESANSSDWIISCLISGNLLRPTLDCFVMVQTLKPFRKIDDNPQPGGGGEGRGRRPDINDGAAHRTFRG